MGPEETPSGKGAERLVRAYRGLALMTLNTLLLFLALNVAAVVGLAVYEAWLAPPPGPLRYGMESLARVYPGWSEEEIEQLLRESWTREYVYAPFVQHREPELRGRFVNVSAEGFRLSRDQGPWPPSSETLNIFVFGGSTTFGYGVADHETVPSRLQEALSSRGCARPARVYNFGRGNYYGEQERTLFEQLLSRGTVPEVALFIDGLNEWKEAPKFTRRLEYLQSESQWQLAARALKDLPALELLKVILERRESGRAAAAGPDAGRQLGEKSVARWLRGKRMIEAVAGDAGVRAFFVWQPAPVYGYDLEHHLFVDPSDGLMHRHRALQHGYRLLAEALAASPEGDAARDLFWLGDIQRGLWEPLYVDAGHYTASFSVEIAEQIAAFLAASLPCGELAAGSGAPPGPTSALPPV